MKTMYYLCIAALLLTSCKQEETQTLEDRYADAHPEALAIAKQNGLAQWDAVTQIDFTFNVDRNGNTVSKRGWSWKPKTGDVTMIQNNKKVTYNQNAIDSTAIKSDQAFINDKFWLLIPLQLVWDEGTQIIVQDSAVAPISQQATKKLTILYGDKGGYTPGDAYDIFYTNNYQIKEWVFRKSNSTTPSLMNTFENYQTVEGIPIATEHKDADNTFNLYFTNITITTEK